MRTRPLVIAAALLLVVASTSVLGADNRFYRILAAKPNAEIADAVRGFYELVAGRDAGETTFEQQAAVLIELKVIPPDWTRDPKARLTRGRAAYLICTSCDIKGGATMRVFGPSERYAFRECVFLGIWDQGTQRDYLSGNELMGLLKWAADYLEAHREPSRTAETEADEAAKPAPAEGEKPEAVETPAAPMPSTTYIVRKDDTFAKISVQFYGTPKYDTLIMKANDIKDPWMLKPGQTLEIPPEPAE